MKYFCRSLLFILSAFALNGLAEESSQPYYVKTGVGITTIESRGELTRLFSGIRGSGQLGAGYKLDSNWAVELSYVGLHEYDIHVVLLEGIYSYPITSNLNVNFSGGTQYDYDNDSRIIFDNGITYTAGVGLSFSISQAWSIDASTRLNGGENIHAINALTVRYHF